MEEKLDYNLDYSEFIRNNPEYTELRVRCVNNLYIDPRWFLSPHGLFITENDTGNKFSFVYWDGGYAMIKPPIAHLKVSNKYLSFVEKFLGQKGFCLKQPEKDTFSCKDTFSITNGIEIITCDLSEEPESENILDFV